MRWDSSFSPPAGGPGPRTPRSLCWIFAQRKKTSSQSATIGIGRSSCREVRQAVSCFACSADIIRLSSPIYRLLCCFWHPQSGQPGEEVVTVSPFLFLHFLLSRMTTPGDCHNQGRTSRVGFILVSTVEKEVNNNDSSDGGLWFARGVTVTE